MKKSIFVFVFAFSILTLFAQNSKTISSVKKYETQLAPADFFVAHSNEFNLSPDSELRELPSKSTNHKKYKQYHNNLEVYGTALHLHLKDGEVTSSNGITFGGIDVSIIPALEINEIEKRATAYFKISKEEKSKKISLQKDNKLKIESELLLINESFPKTNGKIVLAYKTIVTDKSKHKKMEYIFNANSGKLIFKQNLICTHHVPGKGKTYHYGEKSFFVDSISPNEFNLEDKVRNIKTSITSEFSIPKLFTDDDNYWDFPEGDKNASAIDAHYCTSKFHDMMKEKFQYEGVDGFGSEMNTVIFDGQDFVNAYWDGQSATFGKGNCHYAPLTTLSIVGHEYTHGITGLNSELVYEGESGALNEGLSDVFGKALEYFEDKANFSWVLDAKIKEDEFAEAFRIMNDPKKVENPEMYKGEFWIDNNDVHYNSAILNYWFYLLVDGKKGTNEKNIAYDVKPVPMIDILNVLFLCQTSYLLPTSGYNEMYELSLEACKSKYGVSSQIFASMEEAWKAVGVPFYDNSTGDGKDLGFLEDVTFENYCGEIGELINLEFEITNNGTKVYEKNTVLSFLIDGTQTVEKTLENDLAIGETISIVLEDAFEIKYFGNQIAFVDLQTKDDFSVNNSLFIFLDVLSVKKDLQFSLQSFEFYNCDDSYINFLSTIQNNSCQTFIQDELKIEFLADNKVIHSINQDLFGDYNSFNPIIIFEEIDPKKFPKGKEITIRMSSSWDETLGNNEAATYINNRYIDKPVSYKFDNSSNAFNDFKKIEPIFDDSYLYNGESYFKAEARDNIPPCKNINDVSITGGLSACLDLSKFLAPRITFDMIQFKSDIAQSLELNKNSNILQIISTDINGITNSKFYNEFNEGVEENYSYELPKGFKGNIEILFYLSNNGGIPSNNFIDSDVILIDNFTIADIVADTDIEKNNTFTLSPNPTNNTTTIKFSEPFSYSVLDIYGKAFVQGATTTTSQLLDTSNMPNGCYYVTITTANGTNKSLPLIKIR
jgi:bacillolysin